jgi:hypothetical protein
MAGLHRDIFIDNLQGGRGWGIGFVKIPISLGLPSNFENCRLG